MQRIFFTDQLDRTIQLPYTPQRIVSLVPSQTELLFDLGLDKEVVGITKFCIHPIGKFAERIKVGGTKNLNLDIIRSLQPDLILGNKEENDRAQLEALMEEFPVWLSNIADLEDAMDAISRIGAMLDRSPEAAYLNHLISAGFNDLSTLALQQRIDQTVAYLIWKDPYLLAGKQTFIDSMLTLNGLRNITQAERYPAVDLSELQALKPALVFLSSEPYPFNSRHLEEFKQALPDSRVLLVDGEMFSWHGSRLIKAVQYLFQLQKEIS